MSEPIVNEVPVIEELPTTEEVTEVVVPPGTKTDSALLLQSLKEEREEKRALKARMAEMEAELTAKQTPETEVFSDEGRVLQNQILELNKKLSYREEQEVMAGIQSKHPQIKDKFSEFEQYRLDNPGMKIETQAKAFLVENDLLETPKIRQGLEKSSGGGRIPTTTGITQEEIDKIRLNNPRKFRDMIKSGQIK